jgi:hypothetical protein
MDWENSNAWPDICDLVRINRAAQLQTLFRAFELQQKEYTLTVKTSADLRDNSTTAIKLLVVTDVSRAKQA